MIPKFFPVFLLIALSCTNVEKKSASSADSIYAKQQSPPITIITNNTLPEKNNKNFYYHTAVLAPVHFVLRDTIRLKDSLPIWLIHAQDLQTPYLLFPGDTVYAAQNENSMAVLKSNIEQKNNEFALIHKMIKETGNFFYFGMIKEVYYNPKLTSANAISEIINATEHKKQLRLNMLKNEKNISDNFKTRLHSLIAFTAINDFLSALVVNRKIVNEFSNIKTIAADTGTAMLKQLDFDDNYMCYSAARSTVSVAKTGLLDSLPRTNAEFKDWFSFIADKFPGRYKNYLLSKYLFSAVKFLNYTPSDAIITQYRELNKDEIYSRVIDELLQDKQQMKILKGDKRDALISYGNATATTDIHTLIKKHKGKVVLLDFWASWCTPCIAEIPDLKKLKQQLKEKDFLAIAVSTDRHKNDWISACEEQGLTNENSFMLLDPSSPFINKYNISTIPRYMLIGKDGKIISADAPRPSDPALKDLIEKNL